MEELSGHVIICGLLFAPRARLSRPAFRIRVQEHVDIVRKP
jgi:hypothetical protein